MAKMKFPNERMQTVKMTGGIREILALAEKLEAGGKSIIHMELGRPDFDSPECAKKAATFAINNGDVHYTDMGGSYELRKAVAEKYMKENGFDVHPDKNVVITTGAMEAMATALFSTVNTGDEVIVIAPFFTPYVDQIAAAGGIVKIVHAKPENAFRVKAEDIKAAVTPKTKLIIINTPNNPSGAVLTKTDLMEIAALAIENDIWVLSDECYEKFIYEGEHISIASLPQMAQRTITVSAASKTWSMTGWRIGWVVCPDEMRPYANKCHQNLTTCATSFAQTGVVEALTNPEADAYVKTMVKEYKRRRDMVMSWCDKIKGFECMAPSGAFYVFPKISDLAPDGFKFCSWLLEEAGVSAVPGEVFGTPGHMRIAYCRSYEYIEEGMRRIKEAADKF